MAFASDSVGLVAFVFFFLFFYLLYSFSLFLSMFFILIHFYLFSIKISFVPVDLVKGPVFSQSYIHNRSMSRSILRSTLFIIT